MALSWPEAFLGSITGVGGIVATAVTIIRLKPSNTSMDPTPEEKREIRESISKLLGHYNELKFSILELKKDNEHFAQKLDDMAKKAEQDHAEVKKLTLILYPLIKDEIADQRRKLNLPASDTEYLDG